MTRLDEVRWADARVGRRQALAAADVLGEPTMPAKRAGTERAVRAQPEADPLKESLARLSRYRYEGAMLRYLCKAGLTSSACSSAADFRRLDETFDGL